MSNYAPSPPEWMDNTWEPPCAKGEPCIIEHENKRTGEYETYTCEHLHSQRVDFGKAIGSFEVYWCADPDGYSLDTIELFDEASARRPR